MIPSFCGERTFLAFDHYPSGGESLGILGWNQGDCAEHSPITRRHLAQKFLCLCSTSCSWEFALPRRKSQPSSQVFWRAFWSSQMGRIQDVGKGWLSLRGVAFMTVLVVLTVSAALKSTLPSFRLSYKIQDKEATVTLWRFWRFRRLWRFRSCRLPPLKLNPPFPTV